MLEISDRQITALQQPKIQGFDSALRRAVREAAQSAGVPMDEAALDRFIADGRATCVTAGLQREDHIAQVLVQQARNNQPAGLAQMPVAQQDILISHFDSPQAKVDAFAQGAPPPDASAFAPQPVGQIVQPCPLAKNSLTHWLQISLIDEYGAPVPDEPFQVRFPDGQQTKGRLDGAGQARFADLARAGTASVCFPNLPEQGWVPVKAS